VEILGNSVEAIAREKSGIIKRGRPTIVSALIPPAALAVIEETARALESPLHLVRPATWDTPRQPDRDPEEDAALFVGSTHRRRCRRRISAPPYTAAACVQMKRAGPTGIGCGSTGSTS
jgi:folylpolyglutamate synthase/dihydropteroate synthase